MILGRGDVRAPLSHCVRRDWCCDATTVSAAAAMQEAARWPIATWFFHWTDFARKEPHICVCTSNGSTTKYNFLLKNLGNKLRKTSQTQIGTFQVAVR